jgi:Family of unknown function (DUF6522)
VQKLKPLAFLDDSIEVDATIVAEGLGIAPTLLLEQLRGGKVTSRCERGTDVDAGHYRLTFFGERRRLRLVVDDTGAIIQRSTIDFGTPPSPAVLAGG